MKRWIILSLMLSSLPLAAAPSDPAMQQRLKHLESELRCLVCQNQTLADSNAELAGDLRREVREQAEQGRTDEEIKRYLQARYGDFVLYKPPVNESTWLLWFGPFVLLMFGFALLLRIVRQARRSAPLPSSTQQTTQEQMNRLLDDDGV